MALLRRFFYQKPPEGLLEITERVYVFDSCFSTDVLDDIVYRVRMRHIVTQLREQFSGSSFLVFNFREGERKSQLMDILSQFDMTVMDYPRQYEGCPVLSLEMIHHFMRSSDSWISLEGHQNIVLLHCERGGWPTLAFMLAGFLIYRKLYTGEQKTLDLLYREAPRGLLRLLTPLNPMPSQIRYLQYITRRNNSLEWPPPDQALTLDCIIVRVVPSFDTEGGCRPIIRVYGLDPQDKGEQTTRMLFNMSKKGKSIRYRRQADCDVIKIDIQCGVQGDVVLECIHVNADLEREEMMFRVMFNTAFIKSNMLMLGKEDIDVPWDAKDCYTKDFRAEVLFTDMDSSCTPNVPVPKLGEEVKGGPPMEDFARVQELFNDVDWTDGKRDAAFRFLQQISSAKSLSESGRIELNDKATKSDKEGNEGQDREEPLRCDGLKQLPPQLSVSSNAPALLPPPPEAPPPAPLETNTSAAAPPPPPPPVSGGEVPLLSSLVPAPKAPTPPPCPSGLKSNAPPPAPSSPSPEVKAPLPPPPPPGPEAPPTPSPPPVAESPPAPLPPPRARGPPAVPPPPGAEGPPAAPTPSPPAVAESPPAPLPPPRARGPPAAPPPPGAKGPPAAPPPPGAKVPGPPPPPPGAKVPGPPPPPPPGGQGPQAKATGGPSPPVPPLKDPKSTPATSVAPPLGTTKNSLKAFHWIKLTKLLQGSLWAEAQKSDLIARSPKIDLLELASLFPAAVSTVGAAGRGDRPVGASLGAKPEKVHLIDMQRAKNCEIMLTKVKMPLPDVASAILALDGSMLDVDQVGNLLKFCPTKEEMETIKGYSGDKEKLGKCEQFFLEMMKVPRVESKLRVFLFKLQFAIQIGDLRRGLNIVNSASKEVRESLKLQEIMQTILSIGNALNQGTARGSAIGFKLDSLLKLNDMRAKDNKTTLMHYLGKVLSDSPDLLEFHKDLAHLEEASKVQLKFLAEEMQAVNKSLEKVEQEITASENDGSVSEGFQKNLKSFLTTAEADVRSLTLLYSETGQNADALVQYFGEDPTRCPFEQVVSVLLNFVVLFKRAHDENIKFAEIERKKAEREAEQEKLKHSPSKKKSNTMKRDAEGGLASKMSKVAKAISG